MKASEIREKSSDEVGEILKGLYQEAFNLRFRHATSQLDNTARIRQVRKSIARVRTIALEMQLPQVKES
jgi:large subunit ribosomal protein L29